MGLTFNFWSALFPLPNLVAMASGKVEPIGQMRATPVATFPEHLAVILAPLPKLIVAVISWVLILRADILTQAKVYHPDWIIQILIRDLLVTFIGGGVWEWLLYGSTSPFKEKMAAKKFNKVYPTWEHMKTCMFWCGVSTVIATAEEVFYLHLLANGLAYETNALCLATFLWLASMPYWRIAHFFTVHRFMHPWRLKYVPDFGKIMYKYVHSLHHKSNNPSTFSGISMHPVESFLYYTSSFVPVLFGAHPLAFLLAKHDSTLAALWGHDGFAFPGGASYPHYVHHAFFEYNYGENYMPLDYLFGTFFDGVKSK